MKKLLILLTLLSVFLVSACGNQAADNEQGPSSQEDGGTRTYQAENGPVEVPANPQRIVGLTNGPNIISLDGALVGVDEWTYNNPLFTDKLEGVEIVSEEDLEKIIELQPDLIIAGSHMNNLDKLEEIAPTIVYTWGKLDYLDQQLEIGKLLNQEAETQAWIDDFTQRAEALGAEIKAKIGEDTTVSVLEADAKNIYVFGNNWARGTEILFQAMDLPMPEKVKQDALGPGYYALSQEIVSEYAGDYIVLSRSTANSNSFFESETWHNIPAVQNDQVIEIDTEASTYSDPITIEYLLDIFEQGFLGEE